MARLIVLAEANNFQNLAQPGNQKGIHFLVSVTNANGAPLTHLNPLDESNFNVRAFSPMTAGGGFDLNITEVTPQFSPTPETSAFTGFYLIDAAPKEKWVAGRYLFAVRAHRPASSPGSLDRGQALAVLTIP